MLAEHVSSHVEDHSPESKRIDATTWGLLLLMTGILLLLPSHTLPEGAWLLLAGAILLGATAVRAAMHLRISAFLVALALLAIAAGAATIAGIQLPLFAVFLVLLGASVVLRSWFARGEH